MVEVKEKSKQLALVLEAPRSPSAMCRTISTSTTPKCRRSSSRVPTLSDVPYPVQMEPHLVVEYYSR